MKTLFCIMSGLWLGLLALSAQATPVVILQVPQTFHQHPVRLLHPYINYWHDRGDAAEKVGLAAFQDQHFQTTACEAGTPGQALVVVEPYMFYNAKMGVFYSEITAKVYTAANAEAALQPPVLTVKGEGQTVGNLSHNAEFFMAQAYRQAFGRVIDDLQKNPAFTAMLGQGHLQTYQALCASIDTLNKPALFF